MGHSLLRTFVPLSALALGSWIGLVGEDVAKKDAEDAIHRADTAIHESPLYRSAVEDAPIPQPKAPTTARPLAVDPSQLPDPAPFPRMNPAANVGKAWLLSEGPAYAPNDKRRLVTLTFDDGPIPETTPVILKILERNRIHATFFFIGRYLDGNEPRAIATRKVAEQILAAGHMIGNHTHDHLLLTTANRTDALAQIEEGSASIERAIGRKPVFFRPPYGQLDPFTEDVLKRRNDEVVMWNVEAADMVNDDPDKMADSLERQIAASDGGLVLLHDVKWSTVETLPKLLSWLRAHRYDPSHPERLGYEIVDLPEYLRETAARPQPYTSRAQLEEGRKERVKKERSES
ncbi:MAG: polysaccharide deacetylase family protein [Polyangiaceae bacterium]